MLKRSEMFTHQSEAAALIKKIRQLLLILRPGGGKTAATLTALADLQPWPALIVAPIRVCENVWAQEAAAWAHLKGLKFELLRGTPAQRLEALDRPAHVYLVNYEMLAWLVREAGVDLGSFGAIVWDEVSMLKSPGSVRFRAVRKALEKAPVDQIRVGLTGTPTGNSLLNLWGEAFVCDTGRSLGRSYVSWRARHFHTVDKDGFVWRPNHGADREIRGALKRSAAFIEPTKSPSKGYREVSIRFDLPRPARKAYEELRVQLVTQLESGKDILSLGKLPLSGKLRQILSGAIYVDAAGETWEEVHTARLDALKDLVAELEGQPLLVAYQFRHEQERIAAAFPGMVRDLTQKGAIDAWNRGDVPLLTLHPLCLHPSTEVLTEYRGWRSIVDVRRTDRVFDGVNFVSHDGCVLSGIEPVIDVFGIKMTAAHQIMVDGKWREAASVGTDQRTRRKALYRYQGADNGIGKMFQLRRGDHDSKTELHKEHEAWQSVLSRMYRQSRAWNDTYSDLGNLERDEKACQRNRLAKGPKIVRTDKYVRAVGVFREFLCRHVANIRRAFDYRAHRQQRSLLPGKLPLGVSVGAAGQQTNIAIPDISGRAVAPSRAMPPLRYQQEQIEPLPERRIGRGCSGRSGAIFNLQQRCAEKVPVYDLVNCGPRHCFVIRNAEGEAFLSHNSGGHGLNLQHGGADLCWFSLPWSSEQYQQTIGRLDRPGQRHEVMVHRLEAKGSLDREIANALAARATVEQTLSAGLAPHPATAGRRP